MVILMSGQQVRHGNDNGGEQMGWSKWGQEGTNADASHPCRQADSRRSTAGIARLPIQSSENTGRIWRK